MSDSQLMMNSSTISSDRDKRDTVRQFGVVSHALSDVIVYFGVKQRTRRQNELAKITSTVLAASSLVLGPCFFLNVFTLSVYLPDSLFSIIKACLLLYSGGVSLRVPWGVCLLILTKLFSDSGFSAFTPQWTLTLNLGFDGKQTYSDPVTAFFSSLLQPWAFSRESGIVTIVMAFFKFFWR